MNRRLVLVHLYPALMNLYGDRGNILCLERRCRWRGIELEIRSRGLGDSFEPAETDLVFIGGSQDREQRAVARDLREVKGPGLRRAAEEGAVILAVCGGYQLLGHSYRPAEGETLEGLSIFDAWTEHPGPSARRCIGNVLLQWQTQTLVGFENHGGRTYLGPGARPLGRVLAGHGNNDRDGTEGAVWNNCHGTYLHGSLLPKNPHFADHLIRLALARRYGDGHLEPLDDSLEDDAHAWAARVARGGGLLRRLSAIRRRPARAATVRER
ncbi:MAG: glutamine amidotransferase [Chloroflexi bacterium]|nr:glutamine amidotransferase [Chloroflexota bacterium]